MRFLAPEWFLLLPVIAIAAWRLPALQLWRPLRAVALLLLLLVLVQPQWRRLGKGLDVWVLVDRSASAADGMAAHREELETLLARSKSAEDRLFFVDYSDVPILRDEGTGVFSGNASRTRTALAAKYALSRMDSSRASRLLVLTDGFSTEPLDDLAERLARQHVALDRRIVVPADAVDFAISKFRIPSRAQPGEPFLVDLEITGTGDGTVPVTISRDGNPLSTTDIAVNAGRGSARFTDRIADGGAHRYEARIRAESDSRSGNNAASAWIEIMGGPRVLLVTNYTDDPVARTLRAQGFQVETVTNPAALDIGRLAGAKVVILNNVPAYTIPPDFLSALDFFVRSQGGGLLMAGGKFSFGSGGYFRSAIDELLPVSMELRMEYRKLAVAMAIVMDRSGSMGAPVAGGATKMDLANEGAARSIELLGGTDAVSVIAVDSEPHVVVPMTGLGANRGEIGDAVRRITSGGGGIFVYNGLQAGWEQLQKSDAGQRHLILFADAADSEEPGAYKKLLAQMIGAGATVSVIGLGDTSDSDATLLADIASRGGGRIFFNDDPASLPALFEQETVAVARSAFLDEPVGVEPSAGWLEIAAQPLEWPGAIDGYNLSYLRPEATAAAYSKDEYKAPLVAFWQRGAGRSAAVSFPLGGEFSASVRAWPDYGDFLQTLNRWLSGEQVPPGIGILPRLDGEQLQVDLLFDDAWEKIFAESAPTLELADGASGKPRSVPWERMAPGRYRARVALEPGSWVRGAIRAGKYAMPFGPIVSGIDQEWQFNRDRLRELETVSNASGGVDRIDLGGIWKAPRHEEFHDLRAMLLTVFLVVFLTDVLLTRLGNRAPQFAMPKFSQWSGAVSRRRDAPRRLEKTHPVEKPSPAPSPLDSPARKERFQRAKDRGR